MILSSPIHHRFIEKSPSEHYNENMIPTLNQRSEFIARTDPQTETRYHIFFPLHHKIPINFQRINSEQSIHTYFVENLEYQFTFVKRASFQRLRPSLTISKRERERKRKDGKSMTNTR